MATTRLDNAVSNAGSLTLAFGAVSAGNDRVLIVMVGEEEGDQIHPDGCTYGDQSMTEIVQEIVPDTFGSITFYGLNEAGISAASGTTVTVSFPTTRSPNPGEIQIHAATYQDADQTTPWSKTISDGSSDPPNPITTVDVNADADTVVVSGVFFGDSGTTSWGADLTEQTDQNDASSASSMADAEISSAGNVDCEGTFSGGEANRISAASFQIGVAVGNPSGYWGLRVA